MAHIGIIEFRVQLEGVASFWRGGNFECLVGDFDHRKSSPGMYAASPITRPTHLGQPIEKWVSDTGKSSVVICGNKISPKPDVVMGNDKVVWETRLSSSQ